MSKLPFFPHLAVVKLTTGLWNGQQDSKMKEGRIRGLKFAHVFKPSKFHFAITKSKKWLSAVQISLTTRLGSDPDGPEFCRRIRSGKGMDWMKCCWAWRKDEVRWGLCAAGPSSLKKREYRDALKGGPQVVWSWVAMLRFVYLVQAGERNFFTSFTHNLGPTF